LGQQMQFNRLKRRDFVTLLGGAATFQFGWPPATRAQQSAQPVIGFLGAGSPEQWASRLRAFHRGLADTGYAEGRNVIVEYRWAESRNDRLQALVADLVSRQVTVIAAPGSTLAAHVAKGMTTTIPIVFATGADPVKEGLVASLNRPGGNVTGITLLGVEIGPKHLELLQEMVPALRRIALMVNQSNPAISQPITDGVRAAAESRGLDLKVLYAGAEHEFDPVFATLGGQRPVGLIIAPDIFFGTRLQQLGALTRDHGLPAIHQFRAFAAAGGLMSYGTDVDDSFRLSGIYAGRVLKGEKPAELPVQRATRVAFVVNMKTANALGLTVPPTLLARADEVIE
jgi:putative tryptophan/tyrosine transport system substrate-binding protein